MREQELSPLLLSAARATFVPRSLLVRLREFADEGKQGQVHGDDDRADGDA